eukprot:Gb_35192 [translate_table: standard]
MDSLKNIVCRVLMVLMIMIFSGKAAATRGLKGMEEADLPSNAFKVAELRRRIFRPPAPKVNRPRSYRIHPSPPPPVQY